MRFKIFIAFIPLWFQGEASLIECYQIIVITGSFLTQLHDAICKIHFEVYQKNIKPSF